MVNFTKILGLTGTALVFAGMAFGQANSTVSGGTANQTPLIRVEGTTELVGEYTFTVSGNATGVVLANILDILSLPVTSKVLATSGTAYTEALAIVNANGNSYQGVVSGSQVTFSGVSIPAGGSTVTIVNIRVNASSLTVGTGTPPAITESAFISGTNLNSGDTAAAPVAYAFTGLSAQTNFKTVSPGMNGSLGSKGSNNFLVCQGYKTGGGIIGAVDVGENFSTAFKGQGPGGPGGLPTANNNTLGSEFANNTETGYQPVGGFGAAGFVYTSTTAAGVNNAGSGGSNTASTATLIQVAFSNIPSGVTLYVPTTVNADQSTAAVAGPPAVAAVVGGTLTLVASPSSPTAVAASTSSSAAGATGTNGATAALTAANGSATAYYLFTPGANSNTLTETFSIGEYIVQSANTVASSSTALTAVVSFAPVGSTQIPNFVVGPGSTTITLSTFNLCTTSLLFPFVTNQLGFDTGIAIANTSSDPFGSKGATAQSGTCTMNFYGSGAPSPSNVATPSIPSGTVYTSVLSGLAPAFQGYIIAQCTFQYAHGFGFITDGVGANGGLSQGYLAGVIPDTNQVSRGTANPIGSVNALGQGETLGN